MVKEIIERLRSLIGSEELEEIKLPELDELNLYQLEWVERI